MPEGFIFCVRLCVVCIFVALLYEGFQKASVTEDEVCRSPKQTYIDTFD